MRHGDLLIDGAFWGGPCDQNVSKGLARNPWNGESIGTYAEASWVEAQAALDAATRAFAMWRRSSPTERGVLLNAIADSIERRRDDLADLLRQEVGKPISLAKAELDRTALTFRLAALATERWKRETVDASLDPRAAGCKVTVERFPVGPILAITPYNWPFNLAAHKIAPALAVGSTLVVKGSEQAALCTLELCRLIHEAGCPAGVVNGIIADARVSERLAADPSVAMISFTGSPAVGWAIKRARPTIPVTLELGGDAFAIVAPDTDLDVALPKIVASAFAYAGQICISTQHALVHESQYPAARERLIELTMACATGDPEDRATLCGPLISDAAADRVEAAIREAEAMGATVLAGGKRHGRQIEPCLIEGAPARAKLASEEVFGPVMTLDSFSTLEQATERVNRSRFGIHTAVFTNDPAWVNALYRDLQIGGLVVNDAPSLRFDAAPYGGEKESGFGREGIDDAMLDMSRPKTLIVRRDN